MKYAKIALQIFIVGWIVWTYTGRSPERKEPYAAIRIIERVGEDSVCGRNVVGIQPYMIPEDYLSYESFFAKMDAYFAEAKKAGYFRSNTVVLLPEYLGTWLIIAGEKESVAQAETVTGAMTLMVLSNPLKTLRYIFYHRDEQDRMAAALFRMKARDMASIYAATFTQLSKSYGVTINAGSIVLPGAVGNGEQIAVSDKAPLFNTSFIFHAFGVVDGQVIRKSFPADLDQAWTARGINAGYYPYKAVAQVTQYSGDFGGDPASVFQAGGPTQGRHLAADPRRQLHRSIDHRPLV